MDLYDVVVRLAVTLIKKHFADLPFPAFGKFVVLLLLHSDKQFLDENPRLKDLFKTIREAADEIQKDFDTFDKEHREKEKDHPYKNYFHLLIHGSMTVTQCLTEIAENGLKSLLA